MNIVQVDLSGKIKEKIKKPKNILTIEQKINIERKKKAHTAFKKFKAGGWSNRLLSDEEIDLIKNVYGF